MQARGKTNEQIMQVFFLAADFHKIRAGTAVRLFGDRGVQVRDRQSLPGLQQVRRGAAQCLGTRHPPKSHLDGVCVVSSVFSSALVDKCFTSTGSHSLLVLGLVDCACMW